MIQIKFVNNFNAADLVRSNIRRGFVIPITGAIDKSLVLINNDFSIDHDRVADEFVKLSEEELRQNLKTYTPNISESDLEKSVWMCNKMINGYKEKQEEYPTSRKDYLLYENGVVAFDQKPGYSTRYILYRGDGKGYFLPKSTDKIACSFLMAGFKEMLTPEDSKVAGPTLF